MSTNTKTCQPSSSKPRKTFWTLDAFSKHKILMNEYKLNNSDKTDLDVLREHHRFLWDSDDESEEGLTRDEQWGRKLAKSYYDKLFKEYCICDLSLYKENKVAMRWRTEAEVMDGKGQFICGNKHCQDHLSLKSWEVNFSYLENGAKKNALVKLRLCKSCSKKLNYKHRKKEAPIHELVPSGSKRKSSSREDQMEQVVRDLLK